MPSISLRARLIIKTKVLNNLPQSDQALRVQYAFYMPHALCLLSQATTLRAAVH